MKKVLICLQYYYPGFRAGGPPQSIMNLVEVLGNEYEFSILTHNHDMGISEVYDNIASDSWNTVGKARVYYSSKERYSWSFLKNIVSHFDLVYLCEPYPQCTYSILMLRRLNRICAQIVLAPMGTLSTGALSQKALKKKVYWTVFRLLKLSKKIEWSFTSELEVRDAKKLLGDTNVEKYYIAEDLPRPIVECSNRFKEIKKEPNSIRLVFLSRICEMKNLLYAISVVSKCTGNILFDIYGTIEDEGYWRKCKENIATLPLNVHCTFKGAVPSEEVVRVLMKYDAFILPTLGENFGHVIYEALMAGCVPIISDQTPWGEIVHVYAGYSIPLDSKQQFVNTLQTCIDMKDEELLRIQLNAIEFAKQKYKESVDSTGYKAIFGGMR